MADLSVDNSCARRGPAAHALKQAKAGPAPAMPQTATGSYPGAQTNWDDLPKFRIGWQLALAHGWGIHGFHLAKRALERRVAMPMSMHCELTPAEMRTLPHPIVIDAGKIEAADARTPIPLIWPCYGSVDKHTHPVGSHDRLIQVFEDTAFLDQELAWLARFEDRIITVSEWNAQALRSHGIPARCVHLGVDTTMFRPSFDPVPHASEDRFTVFSGGKAELRKGQDIVLAAFRVFRGRHPEARLVTMWHNLWPKYGATLAASPHTRLSPCDPHSDRLDLRGWVERNGVPGEAYSDLGFIGRHEMASLLQNVDVAMFPNRCEGGTNMVVMECLAAGVPTILSENSGHRDLIEAGIPCHVLRRQMPCSYGPGTDYWRESDLEEAIEALEHVYQHRGEARRLGRLCAQRMALEWDWSLRMDEQIEALGIGRRIAEAVHSSEPSVAGTPVEQKARDQIARARAVKPTPGARSKKLRTDGTSALLQAAIKAHRGGDLTKAERLYRTVLKRNPRDAIALNDLGVLLVQCGHKESAEKLIRSAIILKPDYAEAHANLGTLLSQKGETDAAIAAFKQAVAAKPDYTDAHCNLALALEKKGDTDGALAAFERAIEIRPDHAEAQFGRANALKAKGRGEEAVAGYRAAITLRPDYAAAHARLGIALTHAGEVDEAIAAYRCAIDCKLQSPEVHSNLALTLLEKDETDAAIAQFRQALMQAPNWPHAHFGLSLALLKKGEHAEGWREYEWRWKGAIEKVKPRNLPKPQWQGEDLTGKTLLLYAEQGLGDTLQFVRFVPSLAERGGRVVLEAPGKVFSLLGMSGVAKNLLPAGAALPEFDFHLPLLSVPAVVGLAEETIPADVPYLAADPARIARWHERLPAGGFRVGIVWQGFPNADIDKGRSIPLRCFAPLAAVPGVRLISLQKNYGLDQLEALPDGMRVETLGADFDAGPDAFLDTAAIMAELDLIITSDTSIAHLAGALGRPVWIVLKTNPDWRWLQDREDSVWYPTARLFRQRMRGDWEEVLQRVAAELAQVAGGNAEKLFAPGKNLPADDRADRAGAQFGEGFRLHKEGLLREAAAAYCKTVTLDPNHAEAYSNLGVIRHAHGKIDEAIALYRRAIEIKPDHASALGNLVVALTAKGDIDGALATSRQAVRAKPDDAEARLRQGDLLRRKDDTDGALASYRDATALKPSSAKAWFSLGFCLQTKGDLDAAVRNYRQAIAIDPQLAQAHANLGVALADSGLAEEGIVACQQAVALKPDNAQYHSNLGLALGKADDLDAALAQYRRAVEIDPNYPEGNTNLALALLEKGMVEEAIACNRKAIALKPDYAEAHFNLSLALLLNGDFSEGWKEYEWRWRGGVKELKPAKSAQPQWQGEDLTGKTLLLQAEQGLGDVLQFGRFAALLTERGARIILAVPRELAALLRTVPGAPAVVSAGDRLPPYDFYVPMMSVPVVLGTTERTIPSNLPYLSADPERVASWRARLRSDGFKIGIAWQGHPDAKIDKGRSLPLRAFEPVASIPGVRLISLQKNHGLDQLGSLPAGMRVETLGTDFDSGPGAFLDTAAVMENLDLVITSDTSVAHLAGALGRPVWIVLKHMPDWRWLLEREDSPWYPTARLFRQRKAGDWADVFERVKGEVARMVRSVEHKAPKSTVPSVRIEDEAGHALRQQESGIAHGGAAITSDQFLVPISLGELVDKITILEIKSERITDPAKLANVNRELELLRGACAIEMHRIDELKRELGEVNERLWAIEDEIRDCERSGDFGRRFVELARSVYKTNDRRADIKRKINLVTGSSLMEEKSYSGY